ncbi:UDP-2,4-diacetamido-2,4,6-trideoxy-beta-L-altropyranose hydrolase [Terasakiella sp. SH-1]|uniref:UDP-2,4-diacetamido-2,4, 6-trideoxy-beta-L-altropyranose hydrolase n=1 Tax=Terasakiella sp. SH-1 TaxID=2560057 RepID=UPI0010741F82|nr:UDP-2,4-diacetamido-2,4,6-trideoxy-beta-L-altropyranose hydrolase [Terasakiella sp. SH-1]
MQRLVFRTNASSKTGIGHLYRCIQLAQEFKRRECTCIFVLDTVEDLILPYLQGFTYYSLYDTIPSDLNPTIDAEHFLHLCQDKLTPDFIILDDYRLGKSWEEAITSQGLKLCCIDDLKREHTCDYLIDMSWNGPETLHTYDNLLPDHATKLLGPHYVILPDKFNRSHLQKNANRPFSILLSMGGGGDLNFLQLILNDLENSEALADRTFHIFAVIGPLAKNKETFLQTISSYENVSVIEGKTDLFEELHQTDLFIGAAGGMIYQVKSLNIPALTFSIAESQNINRNHLEDIGHYFHLNKWSKDDFTRIAPFVRHVMDQPERFQALEESAILPIDGQGCKRIANALLNKTTDLSNEKAFPKDPQEEKLSDEHSIRKATDCDLNHYLNSRNRDSNRTNMVQSATISQLDHYGWWFSHKRDNFLLSKDDQPNLYIWHEKRTYQEQDYLIGGWFVCTDDTNFQDALLALTWQLDYCAKEHPNVPWVAVIQRDNKFVKLLNDYMGFIEIGPNHPFFEATGHFFNGASPQDFYYVIKTEQG